MKIGSNATSQMQGYAGKKAGGSAKDIDKEEQELQRRIQDFESKKSDLSKQIDKIKGDFAPPKPKDELIRPLKDQIQKLDKQIQQMQAEISSLQAEKKTDESSKSADDGLESEGVLVDIRNPEGQTTLADGSIVHQDVNPRDETQKLSATRKSRRYPSRSTKINLQI